MGKIHDRFRAKQASLAGRRQAEERQRQLDRNTIRLGAGTMQIDGGRKFEVSEVTLTPAGGKGQKDGLCNCTDCQKPGAYYFNTGTRAYYCLDCACQIRPWGLPDFDLFPDLKPDDREGEITKHFWSKRRAFVEVATPQHGAVMAERMASNLFRLS